MNRERIISQNESENIKEYARSTPEQRLTALFYMQTHWIRYGDKLIDIDGGFYLNFIKILKENEVEYLIIGDFAVNFYGYPRNTHDLSLWINTENKNVMKLFRAIDEYGFDASNSKTISLQFKEPIKLIDNTWISREINLLPITLGMADFSLAYKNSVKMIFDNVELVFISYNDLLASKLSNGEARDFEDISILNKVALEVKSL